MHRALGKREFFIFRKPRRLSIRGTNANTLGRSVPCWSFSPFCIRIAGNKAVKIWNPDGFRESQKPHQPFPTMKTLCFFEKR